MCTLPCAPSHVHASDALIVACIDVCVHPHVHRACMLQVDAWRVREGAWRGEVEEREKQTRELLWLRREDACMHTYVHVHVHVHVHAHTQEGGAEGARVGV